MTYTDATALLLGYMPIIVRSAGITDWERKFCASIIKQSNAGNEISRKQIAVMQRIVNQFRERHLRDDEETVIDGDGE